MRYDHEAPCENSSTSKASDGSSDDEGYGVRCHAADQTSQLEEAESGEVGPFHVEEHEDASVEGLERRCCEQVGRSVPADVVE